MNAQQYYRSIRKDREAWREEMPPRCMKCLKKFDDWRWSEIHEIEKRSQAPNNWWARCSAILLCNPCHWEMDDAAEWPHAKQLAIKWLRDPENFDLDAWLAIKPRPDSYVTVEEIEAWMQTLR